MRSLIRVLRGIRNMGAIIVAAFTHPLTASTIDLDTGKVTHGPKKERHAAWDEDRKGDGRKEADDG